MVLGYWGFHRGGHPWWSYLNTKIVLWWTVGKLCWRLGFSSCHFVHPDEVKAGAEKTLPKTGNSVWR